MTSSADVMTSFLVAVTSSVVAAEAVAADTLVVMAADLMADLLAAAYYMT